MSWKKLTQLYHKTPAWLIAVLGAIIIYTTQQVVQNEPPTVWISLVLSLVVVVIIIIKTLIKALRTHVIFIDMPDPDNYAAALLRAHQSKQMNNWCVVVCRRVLQMLGYAYCPLYVVCGGRLVNLGLAHKNRDNRFFDEATKTWLDWDYHRHIGPLPADIAIMHDPETVEDSVLVLKKNMFDLDCILQKAGYSDYVLVTGDIAKQIPLSYSHHADEWRFYNNVEKHWVTINEYDKLTDERCNKFEENQDFDQRRQLARQFINQLTGISDFESSLTGSHWLNLDQLHMLLFNHVAIDITMAGPATDMAYLVNKSSDWTRNVNKICAMWAVCELGPNTGKMNVCGMNFNEAADIHDAQYLSPKHFPNATFSFLPTETCKLTPQFKVTCEMAEHDNVLKCVAEKIALWTHVKGGRTEPLFDYFICESSDITATLHNMGLIKVFVTPYTSKGYMILCPSANKTLFTAWVNPSEMFRNFSWGQNEISFNGTHWSDAKVVG